MSIDRKTVLKVADLARLELTEAEIPRLTEQMAAIVSFVERINELDTTGIEPAAHVLALVNRTRPDELIPSPATPEEILALAPDRTEDCIRVPRVLD